ncbi:MAG: phage terminase small subunit P27 family [Phycisphaeraceae bacterium]|nr:phage terminase small subunit P27 family [Phycisphaeraceae bacterium]
MTREAIAEWDRLAPHLAAAGLLSDRFLQVFAAYCQTTADYWAFRRQVAEQGATIWTEKGNLIQHPAVGMAGKCLDRKLKLERELGLTPAAATGLNLGGPEKTDDPLDQLLAARSQAATPTGSADTSTESPADESSLAACIDLRSSGTSPTSGTPENAGSTSTPRKRSRPPRSSKPAAGTRKASSSRGSRSG